MHLEGNGLIGSWYCLYFLVLTITYSFRAKLSQWKNWKHSSREMMRRLKKKKKKKRRREREMNIKKRNCSGGRMKGGGENWNVYGILGKRPGEECWSEGGITWCSSSFAMLEASISLLISVIFHYLKVQAQA